MAKKDKSQAQEPKKSTSSDRSGSEQLPYLLDFSFQISGLVIFLLGITTTTISLFAGASILIAALRGGVAMLVLGFVTWLVNYWLSNNALETVFNDVKRVVDKSEKNESRGINA